MLHLKALYLMKLGQLLITETEEIKISQKIFRDTIYYEQNIYIEYFLHFKR